MLKKTITYTDYNGLERTEDFYFNLTKAEITEMEIAVDGGMSQYLINIANEKNPKKIVDTFKDIVYKAYGVKSTDGKHFVKSKEVKDAFTYTEAYSNLFMELATNADAASMFMNGIIPQQSQIQAQTPPYSIK